MAGSDHDSILAKAPCLAAFARPQYIFEVVHHNESSSERAFRENLSHFQSCYAYHGSKVFNFYSILNYGLQQHLNQTALFGEGIYLSEELHVSEMFAPTGAGWPKSTLGRHLACIAICEYINDPAFVKTQEENKSAELPEKYILVQNNDLVQVRYLLVYSNKRQLQPTGTIPQWNEIGEPVRRSVQPLRGPYARWMWANRGWLTAAAYFGLLVFVGWLNSRNAHYMKHYMKQMFLQKINYMRNALFGAGVEGET